MDRPQCACIVSQVSNIQLHHLNAGQQRGPHPFRPLETLHFGSSQLC